MIFKNHLSLILLSVILLASCKSYEPNAPYVYETNPHYYLGYEEFYGAYYSNYGIKNNTFSLSLFSDSLKFDDKGQLTGFGQYLYLEDVFMAPTDTLLPLGTYRVNTTGNVFSFYAGRNDTIDAEVYTKGAYIYYIEQNSAKSTLKLITDGYFTVSVSNEKYKIVCNFKTEDKTELKGTFNADLGFSDQSIPSNMNIPRTKLRLNGYGLSP